MAKRAGSNNQTPVQNKPPQGRRQNKNSGEDMENRRIGEDMEGRESWEPVTVTKLPRRETSQAQS